MAYLKNERTSNGYIPMVVLCSYVLFATLVNDPTRVYIGQSGISNCN
jgi:hypothetical protein